MTFKEQIAATLLADARKPLENYFGNDWWELSDEERYVLAIEPPRWFRMVIAWGAYEVLLGIVDAEDYDYAPASVAADRTAQAALVAKGRCLDGFQVFAKEYASLTFREAAAVYYKMHFWNVRAGTIDYADE